MFCQMCGYKLEEGQANCPNCGALSPVASAASPTPAEMAPVEPVMAEVPPVAEEPVMAEVPPVVEQPVMTEVPPVAEQPMQQEEAPAQLDFGTPVAEQPMQEEAPTQLNFGTPVEEQSMQQEEAPTQLDFGTPVEEQPMQQEEAPTQLDFGTPVEEQPVQQEEAPTQLDFGTPVAEQPVQQEEAPTQLDFGTPVAEQSMQQNFTPAGEQPMQGFGQQGAPMQGFGQQGAPMQQGFAPQGASMQQGFAPQGAPMPQGFAGGAQPKKKFPVIPVIAAAFAMVVVICGVLTLGHFKLGWFVAYNPYQYSPTLDYLTWYMEKKHSNIKPKDYEIVSDFSYTILRYKDKSKEGGYGYVTSENPDVDDKGDQDKYEPYDMKIVENYSTNGRIITKLEDSDGDELVVAADTNGRVTATYCDWYDTYTFYAYKSGRLGEKIYVYDTEDTGINEFSEYATVNDGMADIDAFKYIYNYDSKGSITSIYTGDEEEDEGHFVFTYKFTGAVESGEFIPADPEDGYTMKNKYVVEKKKLKSYAYDYNSDDENEHKAVEYTYNQDGTTTVKVTED